MLDRRIHKAMLDLEVRLNHLAAEMKISGLSARRETLTRQDAVRELEKLADRVEKITQILEKRYGWKDQEVPTTRSKRGMPPER
jgi:hypothetical protein